MKKINQSGPFGRCLAGDATLTIDGKVIGTVSNFKADSIEIEASDIKAIDMTGEMNWVFASSDRDALKPDNGDRRFATIEPAKSDNAQLEFYRTMFGAMWPDANTDASLFGEPDVIIADDGGGEPISLAQKRWSGKTLVQQREEAALIEAHLKALPPLPAPYSRELRVLAGGTFGKTSPRPPSHMYQDALDYFEQHAPARTVRLRAFGKSLPGALFRSGDLLQFFDGEYAGNAFIRPGVKRDIAMERVHHHVDAWSVRRRFAGMVDRLPKRLRMAIVIHRAFGGQA